MSIESRSTAQNRKRFRQVQFDLNRSTPHVAYKIHKFSRSESQARTELNLEMEQNNSDGVRDLSRTIISNNPNITNMPTNPENVLADRLGQGTSKQYTRSGNIENMENSIKKLVDQGINSQLVDIRKAMLELTSTVSRLSVVVQQTQQENKKIMEFNLPNITKTSSERPQAMETSCGHSQSSRASSIQSEEVARSFSRPRIDKWGLEFDGDTNKLAVEDFVFRLERLQNQYEVSWREVLDNFHLLVKGAAEKWYWLFIKTNYMTEWPTLKTALLKQYQSTRSSFELMRDMVERKQLPGESIDEFFFTMTQLRSRLSISMPEAEMIKMIKKNLRDSIGRIVYPMAVSSVEELRMSCLDAEKTFLKKETRSIPANSNRYHRYVNELSEERAEQHQMPEIECDQIAAVRMQNATKTTASSVLVCWNCRQNGHVFMDYPAEERAIFCYRCGKPDVIAPNCANCRNKHFSRNEGSAGGHRSTTNPRVNLQ